MTLKEHKKLRYETKLQVCIEYFCIFVSVEIRSFSVSKNRDQLSLQG